MPFDKSLLLPGDALFYYEHDISDILIAIKTAWRIGHVEIYDGHGMSVASRNGIGVNRYALRLNGLVAVRRPWGAFDWAGGQQWFEQVRGQKYDWLGLLCFWLAVKQGSPDRMFCSEFALRRYRKSHFQPLNSDQDADRTAPGLLWASGNLWTVWQGPAA